MSDQQKMEPIPDPEDCCVTTLDDFVGDCKMGMFTDDDGHGYYATKTEMSNKLVDLRNMYRDNYDKDPKWTHVVWFNK